MKTGKLSRKIFILLALCCLAGLSSCADYLNDYFGFTNPYKEKICTITYVTTAGECPSSISVKYGTELTSSQLPELEASGRNFLGWYYDDEKIEEGYIVIENMTINGKWENIVYTITYELDGGTNSENNPGFYTVDTDTIIFEAPAKEGYFFGGWYADSEYTVRKSQIASGSVGDLVLYAKWETEEVEKFTVSFVSAYGIAPSSIDVEAGTMLTAEDLLSLSENGWIFDGWYLDAEYTNQVESGYIVNESITLYAKWEEDTSEETGDNDDYVPPDMVQVITESTTITGDQSSGVFPTGRTVTLSPYSIGKYEVTQKLFEEIMGTNPSYCKSNPIGEETQELRPVEEINWYMAIAFCNKLSLRDGYELCYSVKNSGNEIDWENLTYDDVPSFGYYENWIKCTCDYTKNGYRLPTEAEWEFAARGGDQNESDWNYTYSGSDDIDSVGWYGSSIFRTHEVGTKDPNRLGIYDMTGNVMEWCKDANCDIDSTESVVDPELYNTIVSKELRGGGCVSGKGGCTVSSRFFYYAYGEFYYGDSLKNYCGIRLARSADNWEEEHNKAVKKNQLLDMVQVITESTTITGDQTEGVFPNGRTVILSPYSIGKYQVTQKTYEELMGANPSYFSSNPTSGETQELRPVEQTSWYMAIAFCNKLSLKAGYNPCYSVKNSGGDEIDWENLSHSSIPTTSDSHWNAAVCDMTKNGYRLPTEAEWEFAARGGDQSAADWNYQYSGSATIGDVAWHKANSSSKTHEVGLKNANRLGIYDMNGNSWEWCEDMYDSISSSETVIDPTGAASGAVRVLRSGGCSSPNVYCTISYRDSSYQFNYSNYLYGFRLARSADNWVEEHNKAVDAPNTYTVEDFLSAIGDSVTTITCDSSKSGITKSDNGLTVNVYGVKLTGSFGYDSDTNVFTKFPDTLVEADLRGLDTSKVTSMEDMFRDCSNLTSIDLSSLDTSSATNMTSMFYNCSSITTIDLSNFDTSNVESLYEMFNGCSSIMNIDVSNFDTSKVRTFCLMFNGCSSLTNIDIGNFDTTNVGSTYGMFSGCTGLTSIDLSCFKDSKVGEFACMFSGCTGLTELDVSFFDTSNATRMDGMFEDCSSLTTLDLSNFNTSNVVLMRLMFYGCTNLKTLDLSKFDFSNVTQIDNMFRNCSNLESVDLGNSEASSITQMNGMFYGCSSLTELDLSNFDTSNVTEMYSLFDCCTNLKKVDISNFDFSNVTRLDNMFGKCNNLESINLGSSKASNITQMNGMFYDCLSLTELDLSNFYTSKVTIMNGLFYGCSNLKKIDISNFNFSNVERIDDMFNGCSSLESIDLGSSKASNITQMNGMFLGCSSLTRIDLSNFYASKVTGMNGLFQGCSNLKEVNVSNFDTSSVDRMDSMFNGCSSLTELDLSNFDTSNVETFYYMFDNCSSLTELDLSGFDTTNTTTTDGMFFGCSKLTEIKISSFDVSKVTNMANMFNGCSSLTLLDLSKFDTSNVETFYYMFGNCSSLTELDLSNFNTTNTTTTDGMFFGCSKLTEIKISSFDVSKVTNMANMFNGCSSLTSLDLSNFDTSNVETFYYMFSRCSSLTELDLGGFDTSKVTDTRGMFSNCGSINNPLSVYYSPSKWTLETSETFGGAAALTWIEK